MMPKSKGRKRKKGARKGPFPSMSTVEQLAKYFDTPEMRAEYRRQKRLNPGLDKEVDDSYEQLKEIINHDKDSV